MLINRLLSAAIGVLLLSLVAAVAAYKSAQSNAKKLQSANYQLTAKVTMLKKQHKLMNVAYEELSATKFQIQSQAQTVIQHINKAPVSDNAAIAPVLKQALEAIP